MKVTLPTLVLLAAAAIAAPQFAFAQKQVTETFNSTTTNNTWYTSNGACLTASTAAAGSANLTIPGCVTSNGSPNSYYSKAGSTTMIGGYNGLALPDPVGYGALRLTNGSLNNGTNGNDETGLIVSNTVLPSANGLQFSFNTVTYGGNGYNNGVSKSGADGISFFLLDASYYPTPSTFTNSSGATVNYYPVSPGAFGGSLGYDCSVGKGGGISGGYIGLGIDEYGNYVNKNDNGYPNDPGSPGFSPSTIGLRGAGSINATSLGMVGGFGSTNGVQSPIAQGPITSPVNVCNYSYYTYYAGGNPPTINTKTVTNPSTMPSLGQIFSSTPSTDMTTSTVVWASAVSSSSNSYTQSTAVFPIWKVMDYPIIVKDPINSNGNSTLQISNQEAQSASNTTPAPSRNAATVISYTLTLTHDSFLSLTYSVQGGSPITVLPATLISNNNGPVPANFLFGFASSTGGGSNVHEITCFKAIQLASASASAAGNIPLNSRFYNNQSLYLAAYNAVNWTGTVQSFQLTVNTDGSIAIPSAPTWDADCVLTGSSAYVPANSCPSGTPASPTPATRAITTWNDTSLAGVPFAMSNLSTNEWAQFNADGLGSARIAYLQGSRASETTGQFRSRNGLLGDIIDSSPVWVGPPQQTQLELSTWSDQLYPQQAMAENSGAQTYSQFIKTNGSRLNVVYVGANDGMLHGFSAGTTSVNSSNTIVDSATNTGQEVMAYIPQLALYTLHSTVSPKLDLSSTYYSHNDFVDATPGSGDLFYGGYWHSWLVGGLGVGSQANGAVGDNTTTMVGDIYAMDVTSPTINQSAATVANNIIGDWTSATITCTNSNVTGACGPYMGAITGTPIIRRLHSGNWAVIFGNGLNSANGTAGIFIMEIAIGSGGQSSPPTITFDYIDTGAGPSSTYGKNGISYVASADMEDDHVVDYIYAGDALGNVWRFDLTGYSAASKGLNWKTAISNNQPFLLFKTPTNTYTDSSGTSHTGIQPITTSIAEESATYNGQLLNMIDFGTGRQYPQTLTSAQATAPGQQALYGIWDWNMAQWNSLSTTQYAYSSSGPGGSPNVPSLSQLTQQTLTAYCAGTCSSSSTVTAYFESNNMVCYPGMIGSCNSTPSPSWGWYLNLPTVSKTSTTTYYEQIVYSPTIQSGLLLADSIIGNGADPLTCSPSTNNTGFTYGIDAAYGGASTPTFNTAAGVSVSAGNVTVVSLSAVGTPLFVTATGTNSAGQTQNVSSILYQTSNGTGGSTVINSSTATGKRVSWLELR